jgi:hypothetical protein
MIAKRSSALGPRRNKSPLRSNATPMRLAPRKVPFLDARSRRENPPPGVRSTRAWCSLTPGSSTTRSASAARPMMTGASPITMTWPACSPVSTVRVASQPPAGERGAGSDGGSDGEESAGNVGSDGGSGGPSILAPLRSIRTTQDSRRSGARRGGPPCALFLTSSPPRNLVSTKRATPLRVDNRYGRAWVPALRAGALVKCESP